MVHPDDRERVREEARRAVHQKKDYELSRDRARTKRPWPPSGSAVRSLSPRELETIIHVARGRLSKQIAGDIGIAEATVKVHRSKAMRKMNAHSLPELGRMVDKLNLAPEEPPNS